MHYKKKYYEDSTVKSIRQIEIKEGVIFNKIKKKEKTFKNLKYFY
jgi:hypothetical protein